MWAKIERDEAVHNELAVALGLFKDQVMGTRNRFVFELSRKYGVSNPRQTTIDPVTKRLCSIFSPDLPALKIKGRPREFEQAAARQVVSAIKELQAIFQATHERDRHG